MEKVQKSDEELKRLNELKTYKILDTPSEVEFDDIAQVASTVTGCEFALVSLIDSERVWFKAKVGLDESEVPREHSICSHTVEINELTVINDLSKDEKFKDRAFVTGSPHLRFYAGVPIVGRGGYVIGSLSVFDSSPKQLTESQRHSLEALGRQILFMMEARLKNEQFEEAEKVAKLGSWSFDIESQKIYWSDQLFKLFGREPSAAGPEFEEHVAMIYEEDREMWLSKVQRCLEDGEPYEMEFRGTYPTGKIVWLKAFGQAIKDDNGKTISLSGTCQDITESKRLQIENEQLSIKSRKMLEEQKLFLSNTLDNMPAVIYAKDIEGRFIAINKAFKKLFNFTEEQVLGKTNHELMPFEVAEQFRKNDLEIITRKN
ncbi:MAG: PAS domain S-box protein, partial [Bacteriovoracaceae bacterium]|nr:PAS domain S-box protein [Bacteriovoracaceae bacterium]